MGAIFRIIFPCKSSRLYFLIAIPYQIEAVEDSLKANVVKAQPIRKNPEAKYPLWYFNEVWIIQTFWLHVDVVFRWKKKSTRARLFTIDPESYQFLTIYINHERFLMIQD